MDQWVRLNVAPRYHINREGEILDEFDEPVQQWLGDHGEPLVSLTTRQGADFTFDMTYLLEETFAGGRFDEERWVTIGVAPDYEVSSLGRVRHRRMHRLVQDRINDGKKVVGLRINARRSAFFDMQDLLAEAFSDTAR